MLSRKDDPFTMGCPTRIVDIQLRLETVSRFEPVIAVLKVIHAGQIPKKPDAFVREHFANFGAMFRDGRVPSHPMIQEAAQPSTGGPSPEWIDWFLGVVRERDFEDRGIDDGLGSAFSRETENYNAVFVQIPPRLFSELGEDFEPRVRKEAVRAHLRDDVLDSDLDTALRRSIENVGGRDNLPVAAISWWQLKPLLQNAIWEIVWPDVPATVQRVEQALAEFQREGVTDLAPSCDDVVEGVRRLLDEHCPSWIPQDGRDIDPADKQRLLASVLPHPHLLSNGSFRTVIKMALQPAEVSSGTIEAAIRQLFDAGELRMREITYRPPGGGQPLTEAFFCPSIGVQKPKRLGPERCGLGEPRVELRKRAEAYLRKRGGLYPGLKTLARLLDCAASSLANAIKDSSYLKARKAEHEESKKCGGHERPLTDMALDRTEQGREPAPDVAAATKEERQARLNSLITAQTAEQRADSRYPLRSGRSQPRP